MLILILLEKIKMDDRPLLRPALRAIGFADVRFGFLPPQSGLRRNDERNRGFPGWQRHGNDPVL